METYLPIIQTILNDWLEFSSEHTLYAVSVAIIVWLLIAFLYSFRISSLKKQITASDTAKTAAETALSEAQQQLQQAQDDLSAANQHFSEQKQAAETQQQRAVNVEKQLAERNQQLAAVIQKFASSFDIGERPVPITADLKADALWQQHDKAVTKLLDNLRTEQLAKTELQKFYQAEKDKVATIENRLLSLQTSLDEQTRLLTTLQNQNNTLQQQQNAAQHALSEAMQKHQADLARLTQLEVNALQTAPKNDANNLKNLFKKPEPKPVAEPVISTPKITATPEAIVTDILITSVEDETPAPVIEKIIVADIKPTPKPVAKTPTTPVAEVKPEPKKAAIKGLLNQFTTKSTAEKPTVVEIKPEPSPVTKPAPVSAPKEKTKLKSLFNKFSTKPAVEQAPVLEELKPAPVVEVKPAPASIIEPTTPVPTATHKAKGAYPVPDSKLSDDIPSTRIEDLADKITDTVEGFKKLFSKKS